MSGSSSSSSGGFSARLKSFDFYPKTIDDFRIRTFSGGFISLISLLLIAVLVIYEFMYYMQLNRIDRLFVDTSEQKKLPIYLNITFPGVPCSALSIDVMDVSGEHQIGIEHTIFKQRLDKHGNMISESMEQADLNHASHHRDEEDNGKKMKRDALQKKMQAQDYCGSCYGAESSPEECCNTCQQVREAYRRKGWAFKSDLDIEQCFDDVQERVSNYAKDEGCYMSGYFLVNKVAGNFHFAPGHSYQHGGAHVHDFQSHDVEHFDPSHVIHFLGFGEQYPGMSNPLDNTRKIVPKGSNGLFQYFIKVVPTVYENSSGKRIETNQFSVTEHFRPRDALHPSVVPGVFFMFDLSPIMMSIKEESKSFVQFLTSLCAIVGGILTVSSLVDNVFYNVSKPKRSKTTMMTAPM